MSDEAIIAAQFLCPKCERALVPDRIGGVHVQECMTDGCELYGVKFVLPKMTLERFDG